MTAEATKPSRRWLRGLGYVGLHAIGLVLLAWILTRIDLSQLGQSFRDFGIGPFLAGSALLVGVYLCKSLRWMLICRTLGARLRFFDALCYYIVAVFFSVITPGRVGDFAKVIFLKRAGLLSGRASLLATLADRVWDLLVLGCAAVISLLWLGGMRGWGVWGGCGAVALLPILFYLPELWSPLTGRVVRITPGIEARLGPLHDRMVEAIRLLRGRVGLAAMILSMAGFAMLVAVVGLFVLASPSRVGASTTTAAVALSNVLSFLPITVAGMGTRELVFSELWTRAGQQAAVGVAVGLGYFTVAYCGTAILGGVFYLASARRVLSIQALKDEAIREGADA
jgi:glycosyltransferase 2 family protein